LAESFDLNYDLFLKSAVTLNEIGTKIAPMILHGSKKIAERNMVSNVDENLVVKTKKGKERFPEREVVGGPHPRGLNFFRPRRDNPFLISFSGDDRTTCRLHTLRETPEKSEKLPASPLVNSAKSSTRS
jgi:hypothetical protein